MYNPLLDPSCTTHELLIPPPVLPSMSLAAIKLQQPRKPKMAAKCYLIMLLPIQTQPFVFMPVIWFSMLIQTLHTLSKTMLGVVTLASITSALLAKPPNLQTALSLLSVGQSEMLLLLLLKQKPVVFLAMVKKPFLFAVP